MIEPSETPSFKDLTIRMRIACLCVVIGLLPASAFAEYLGLVAGRLASPAHATDLSVELGIVAGDLDEVDYQNIGARVNYKFSNELVVMGTFGISEYGETDGLPLGLGVLYHLSNQRISQKVEIAGRASYHFGDYSLRELDGKLSSLSLEVLVSGAEPLTNNGLSWYTNFGFHRNKVDFGIGSDSELGLGAGLVLPTGSGEAYIGADFIGDVVIGLGFRYFVP